MGFLRWLLFWEWMLYSDDRDEPSGCLPFLVVVLVAIGLFVINAVMASFGIEHGLSKIIASYFFISFWDFFLTDQPEFTDGFKLMMFTSALVGLIYFAFKYLKGLHSNGKKEAIFYFFVFPHVLVLFVRVLYTAAKVFGRLIF